MPVRVQWVVERCHANPLVGEGEALGATLRGRSEFGEDGLGADPGKAAKWYLAASEKGQRWFPIPAPVGTVFHNRAECLARAQKAGRDRADARARADYTMRKDKHEACRNAGRSGCVC